MIKLRPDATSSLTLSTLTKKFIKVIELSPLGLTPFIEQRNQQF